MSVNPLIRLAASVAGWQARWALEGLRRGVARAADIQDRLLRELLAASAASRFGRDFGLARIRTYEQFRRQIPVLDYDRLAPYIEPIKAGRADSLFNPGTRIHMLAMTSGTTGAVKYLPVTDRYLTTYRRAWNAWGIANYHDHPAAWLRPILQITSPMDEERTAAGIPCGAISGLIFAMQKKIVHRFYVVPACVGYIKDAQAKYYTIMRLAVPGDVGLIATANPSTPLQLAQAAERNAESLIRDVRDGTLRADLDIPADVRRQLAGRLRPDPSAADRLDGLARAHGRLLPRHYWKPAVMANWTGGTVGLYLRQFPEYFGDVAVRDLGLVASEARMSVPLADATAAGLLEIHGNFYEFVPADQIASPAPDVLRCHELQAGQDYFVLLTTPGGLFRYHIGDLVRCEAIVGQTPVITFLSKGKHTSSLTGEKLTEHQVVRAAERASAAMGLALGDFVLCPRWDHLPHYALNLEADRCPPGRWTELADQLDRQLAAGNVEYAQKRQSGRLGPIVTQAVQPGFFRQLQERQIRQRHGRREQYKHQFLYTQVDGDAGFDRATSAQT